MNESVKLGAVVAIAGVLILSLVGGSIWFMSRPAQKPALDKPADVAKFIASSDFDKLKLSERQDYLSQFKPGPEAMEAMKSLSETERRSIFEKAMKARDEERQKQAKTYFKLPPEQREAWMANYVAQEDKRFAEMRERFEKMRKEGKLPQGMPGGPPGGGPPGGGPGGPPP